MSRSRQQSSSVLPSIKRLARQASVDVSPYSCRNSVSAVPMGTSGSRMKSSAAGARASRFPELTSTDLISNVSGRLPEERGIARIESAVPSVVDRAACLIRSSKTGPPLREVRIVLRAVTSRPSRLSKRCSAVRFASNRFPCAFVTASPTLTRSRASRPAMRRS